jgi:hypothetical protein
VADRTFVFGWEGKGSASETHRTFAVPIVTYNVTPRVVTPNTGGALQISNSSLPGASSGVAYDETLVLTNAVGTTLVIIKDGPPAPNLISIQPSLSRLTGTPL